MYKKQLISYTDWKSVIHKILSLQNTMKNHILPAILLTLVCAVFFVGIYTTIVWGVAQFAPNSGKGDYFVKLDKKYYNNVGQSFTSKDYFNSRPSAVDYDAAGSGGTNHGITNPDHIAALNERIENFLQQNPEVEKNQIPSELITSSGSGLDPHISIEAAKVQIKRIAKARNVSEQVLEELIIEHTETPLLGLFGTEKINVLKINLALDEVSKILTAE